MRVVFMGTPEFAVPSLRALINSQHEIIAVYTKAPKPAKRGKQIQKSPIHQLAEASNIPVVTPPNFKNLDVVDELSAMQPDIIVVVAYGLIIPQKVLDIPPKGCLNIHPSKLPRFRGAAPIQRTVIAADTETAICIMQMDVGLDTGPVLMQQPLVLSNNITSGELAEICANKGAEMLLHVLDNIDELKPQYQSEDGVVYAPKISKEEAKIDWQMNAAAIDALIRGLNPYPGAYCFINGEIFKIYRCSYEFIKHDHQPGTIINSQLEITCSDGIIKPQIVKAAGKRQMNIGEFLAGNKFEVGTLVTTSK